MKNEIARREIESLDYYLRNHTNDYSEESHTAMMMAIDALSSSEKPNKWHTEPPKKNGTYLIWWCNYVEIARYTDNLYEVDEYDFDDKKRAGWYKYDSEYGYYELECVKAWQELPSDYKESES